MVAWVCAGFFLRCGGHAENFDGTTDAAAADSGLQAVVDGTTADAGQQALGDDSVLQTVVDGATADSGPQTSGDSAPPGVADVFIPNDGPPTVFGAIQKGPFVQGSSVTLSAIGATGTPTGQVFNTQTTDDLGNFVAAFTYIGNVDIQAQGNYYDEVIGALSAAPIVLRALYEVTSGGPHRAHVNLVTHLARDRALALMGDAGMTLTSAEAQAEAELVTALGVGGAGFRLGSAGVDLDELGADNDADAYLLAVSSVLVQAATEQAKGSGGSVDNILQQLIETIAGDVATGATLPATLIAQLRTAEQDLDVGLTMDALRARLRATGGSAAPVDLNRAIDSDGDGFRNSVDTCPLVSNTDQSQVPKGVICKVAHHSSPLAPSEGASIACAGGPPGPNVCSSACLNLGDFDNVGHPALIGCGMGDGGTVGLLAGDGKGRFSLSVPVSLPGGILGPDYGPSKGLLVAYDVDGDGNLDLASQLGWVAGDGAGHFTGAEVRFPDPAVNGGPSTLIYQGLVLADFNGDHRTDVARLVYGPSGNSDTQLAVALGTGPGTFAAPVLSKQTLLQGSGVGWLLGGDLNGDSVLDLVAVQYASSSAEASTTTVVASALLGDGAGGFQSSAANQVTLAQSVYGAALADVDGDGNLDVVAWPQDAIVVAFGDGHGAFGPPTPTSALRNLGLFGSMPSFVVGDMNGDGKADIAGILAEEMDGSVHDVNVLVSLGRTFGTPQRLHLRGDGWYLTSGDLNGDGIADLVVASDGHEVQSYVMSVQQ